MSCLFLNYTELPDRHGTAKLCFFWCPCRTLWSSVEGHCTSQFCQDSREKTMEALDILKDDFVHLHTWSPPAWQFGVVRKNTETLCVLPFDSYMPRLSSVFLTCMKTRFWLTQFGLTLQHWYWCIYSHTGCRCNNRHCAYDITVMRVYLRSCRRRHLSQHTVFV